MSNVFVTRSSSSKSCPNTCCWNPSIWCSAICCCKRGLSQRQPLWIRVKWLQTIGQLIDTSLFTACKCRRRSDSVHPDRSCHQHWSEASWLSHTTKFHTHFGDLLSSNIIYDVNPKMVWSAGLTNGQAGDFERQPTDAKQIVFWWTFDFWRHALPSGLTTSFQRKCCNHKYHLDFSCHHYSQKLHQSLRAKREYGLTYEKLNASSEGRWDDEAGCKPGSDEPVTQGTTWLVRHIRYVCKRYAVREMLKSWSRSSLLALKPEYDAKDSTHSHEDEICDCVNLGGRKYLERDKGGLSPLRAK